MFGMSWDGGSGGMSASGLEGGAKLTNISRSQGCNAPY